MADKKFTRDHCKENQVGVLRHHGVKGQEWGVRNGPPYPIETGMRKGTTLYSVTVDEKKNTKNPKNPKTEMVYTYRDEWDKKVYEGPYATYLKRAKLSRFGIEGKSFVNVHEYRTLKDFKMPTKKQRIDEFKKLYSDEKDKVVEELDIARRDAAEQDNRESLTTGMSYEDLDLRSIKTAREWNTAYELFHVAMIDYNIYETTKEYVKRMAKNYDAMVDDFDQYLYNEARDPVIIFRTKGYVEELSSQKLTNAKRVKNLINVWGQLKIKGKDMSIA